MPHWGSSAWFGVVVMTVMGGLHLFGYRMMHRLYTSGDDNLPEGLRAERQSPAAIIGMRVVGAIIMLLAMVIAYQIIFPNP